MYEQFFHNKGKLEIINKLCCYWNTTTTIFDPYWETSNQACSTKENTSTINQWVKLILHSTAVVWFNSLIHHHCHEIKVTLTSISQTDLKSNCCVTKTVHAWMEGTECQRMWLRIKTQNLWEWIQCSMSLRWPLVTTRGNSIHQTYNWTLPWNLELNTHGKTTNISYLHMYRCFHRMYATKNCLRSCTEKKWRWTEFYPPK